MAKIVLGMGTSHAPQLRMPPSEWFRRATHDHRNPEMWFAGKTYNYPELVEERAAEHFERELGEEKAQARFDACQRALGDLSGILARVKPDVCVILGDDQHEAFHDDNMPAMSIYWGDTVDDAPPPEDQRVSDVNILTPYANAPEERITHPTNGPLGRFLIERLIEDGFDMAHTRQMPQGRHQGAIGHAHNFVYRRLMDNKVTPNVPIFLNTYYPPNQPTMKRCFQLGQALRRALEDWEGDQTVALIASGGLSHFVIEEDLDQHIIEGLKSNDEAKLTDLPNIRFKSGTSEIRNWVVVSGAMAGDGLQMRLLDYVPCYRTEAGTGCAMAFAAWE
jgi:hypothetical protein